MYHLIISIRSSFHHGLAYSCVWVDGFHELVTGNFQFTGYHHFGNHHDAG